MITVLSRTRENKSLYVQVAEVIAREIRDKSLKPGDKLPSQNVLMKKFNVSQATIRQAMLNLSNQGLVTAYQGKGVFVARPRVQLDLSRPRLLSRNGSGDHGIRFEFIGAELVFAPERVSLMLDVETGTQITRYRRKLKSGSDLIGMETANFPISVSQIFSETDLRKNDFLDVMGQDKETSISHINLTVSAGCITDFDAQLLKVPDDLTVMQRIEICKTQAKQPMMMTRTILFADRIDLHSEVLVNGN